LTEKTVAGSMLHNHPRLPGHARIWIGLQPKSSRTRDFDQQYCCIAIGWAAAPAMDAGDPVPGAVPGASPSDHAGQAICLPQRRVAAPRHANSLPCVGEKRGLRAMAEVYLARRRRFVRLRGNLLNIMSNPSITPTTRPSEPVLRLG